MKRRPPRLWRHLRVWYHYASDLERFIAGVCAGVLLVRLLEVCAVLWIYLAWN